MSNDSSVPETKNIKPSKSSLLAKSRATPQPQWPNLRVFNETSSSTEQNFNIGLGDENLIHCIQISRFLQQMRTSDDLSHDRITAPVLSSCEPSQSLPPADLTLESVQELLKRAIVLICVNCGYDITSSSVLQVLVDVGAAFIERICQLLKATVDTSSLRDNDDFATSVSQVFEDIGFSLESLRDHVHTIALRKQRLLQETKNTYGISLQPQLHQHIAETSLTEPLDLVVGLDLEAPSDDFSCSDDWRRQLGVSFAHRISLAY